VNNRWKAAPRRLWPCSTVAWLALACGSGIDDPQADDTDDVAPVIDRDTCEDNALLAGCTPEPEPSEAEPEETDPAAGVDDPGVSELELARAAAENVLRVNCGQCHGPQLSDAAARAGMNYIDDIDQLVNEGKLIPLNAAESPVVRRMRDGSMPPPGTTGPRPSDREIGQVADFVDDPLFWPEYRPATSCEGQLITFDELYQTVEADLRELDSDDREFTRYVTLTNRYNAGVCSNSLDRERFALIKLVNMLSTRASITAPVAIDPETLIYRLDIRDYDWDRDIDVGGQQFRDGWEAIINSSPYAVPFVGQDADNLREDTLTDVPILNADAMLDVAAIGDLYYGLIGVDVGGSLGDFISNDLGINVQDNLDDGEAVRAGTTRSAISREDRVVERHEIGVRQGAFWQSFDADPDGNGSIFADPFDFDRGGTDVIFSLPNGMLGFIIADQNDNIVDESNLLLDTFQDDFVARTSVSCSNCHAQGYNMVNDEVREFVVTNRRRLDRDDFEIVSEIYLDPVDFADVIAEDSAYFQRALLDAGLPVSGADPVAANFRRFNVDIDLATAAGELGLTPEELDDFINLLDPRLAPLREGVAVDRDDFTDVFEESLCIMQNISENQPDPNRCDGVIDN
jgi:mono/diheme cytochrome c family protein